MGFPGLDPVFVVIPPLVLEEVEGLDLSRDAILINVETLHVIQTQKGGTKNKPPKRYKNLRDFAGKEFERILGRLSALGMPNEMIKDLREYRAKVLTIKRN